MEIIIQENGCRDPEARILDTRVPYFCNQVKSLFLQTPKKINIVLVRSQDQFTQLIGKVTQDGAYTKEGVIYIYQPHLFGEAVPIKREDFYRILCQELVYLFYKTNKTLN